MPTFDEAKEEFSAFDPTGTGLVTTEEFEIVLQRADWGFADAEKEALIKWATSSADGNVDYFHFCEQMIDDEEDEPQRGMSRAEIDAADAEVNAISRRGSSRGRKQSMISHVSGGGSSRRQSTFTAPGTAAAEQFDIAVGQKPSEKVIVAFARQLGIDPESARERNFLWLAEEGLLAPLPEGWIESIDPEGNKFFTRIETGITAWQRPTIQNYKDFWRAIKDVIRYPKESKDSINFARDIGMDPVIDVDWLFIAENNARLDPPEEWEICYDDNGDKYFYHKEEGRSKWEHPLTEALGPVFQSLKTKLGSACPDAEEVYRYVVELNIRLPNDEDFVWIAKEAKDAPTKVKSSKSKPGKYYKDLLRVCKQHLITTAHISKDVIEYARHIGMEPVDDANLLFVAEEGLTAPLPHGWEESRDEQGNVFYYSDITGVSSWEHPNDAFYKKLYEELRRVLGRANPAVKDIVDCARNLGMNMEEDIDLLWVAEECIRAPLPKGWTESRDPQGQIFYFNQIKKESAWVHPADDYYKRVYNQIKKGGQGDASFYRFLYLQNRPATDAIRILQNGVRRWKARKKLKELRKEKDSVVKIQALFRGKQGREVAYEKKKVKAAKVIQTSWRNVSINRTKRQAALTIARIIPAMWKRHQLRKASMRVMQTVALFVFRMKRRRAVKRIQRAFRAFKWKYVHRFQMTVWSVIYCVVRVQCRYRQYRAKMELAKRRREKRRKDAALTIQCAWRSYTAVQIVIKRAVEKDQERLKDFFGRYVKRYFAMKRVEQYRRAYYRAGAALMIQTWYRQVRARTAVMNRAFWVWNGMQQSAALTIQCAMRQYLARKRKAELVTSLALAATQRKLRLFFVKFVAKITAPFEIRKKRALKLRKLQEEKALQIQTWWRMAHQRKMRLDKKVFERNTAAATIIQKHWRRGLERMRLPRRR
mmetsp:Transcript_8622/g.23170  ORF Transcript_8622/g.23170 Transcript_8622/m.23170 type:complete len:932 (-) Transcript_8622:52-2847(-)